MNKQAMKDYRAALVTARVNGFGIRNFLQLQDIYRVAVLQLEIPSPNHNAKRSHTYLGHGSHGFAKPCAVTQHCCSAAFFTLHLQKFRASGMMVSVQELREMLQESSVKS